jgi:hypothetical protein
MSAIGRQVNGRTRPIADIRPLRHLRQMNEKSHVPRQLAWVALSGCLTVVSFAVLLPYVRSEAIGVIWPSPIRTLFAGVLMLIGLWVSRRAGPLQYVSYFLVATCFTGYFLALPVILGVAGIRGIG